MLKHYIVRADDVPWVQLEPRSNTRNLLPALNGGPHTNLHKVDSGKYVGPHYHDADQFQVVLEGSMHLPGHVVGPLDVHYTDSNRPYGPFTAGPQGLVFVAMRRKKVGSVYMDKPGEKHPSLKARELAGEFKGAAWEQVSKGIRRKVTMGLTPDEPRVEIIEGAPGMTLRTDPAPFGEYLLLYKGTCRVGGKDCRSYSLRYVEGPEAPEPVVCGPEGATFILTRFMRDG